jgi:hypothetical protein
MFHKIGATLSPAPIGDAPKSLQIIFSQIFFEFAASFLWAQDDSVLP